MRSAGQLLGLFLVAAGISGAVDHVAMQPVFGLVLNAINRLVIERVAALDGYELVANLGVAVVGLLLLVAAGRARPDAADSAREG